MLPWVLATGATHLKTARLDMYSLRAILGLIAMLCWFTALSHLPLATATSLSFTTPIFTALLAGAILGEAMKLRRWTAIGLGFIGMLVIVRPGADGFDPVSLVALVSSLCFASAAVVVKILARTEHPNAIMTYMTIFLVPLTALVVTVAPVMGLGPGWQPVTSEQLAWLAGVGAGTTLGHLGLTRAYAIADATYVQPFLYVQLPMVAVMAYFTFGQVPTIHVFIGAGIIAGSCLYIAHREAQARRTARGPGGNPGGNIDRAESHS
jgi:drug/metabolite transporter (DMT)-like permease